MKSKKFDDCVHVYRAMSLLNYFQNTAFGSLAVPSAKFNFLTLLFCTVYGVVHLRSSFNASMYFLLVVEVVLLCMLVPTGAKIMSLVFEFSTEFHRNMNIRLEMRKDGKLHESKRVIRSLQVLKCKVGPFYYMERKAKLTLADSIANGIAFSLIQ